MLAPILQLGSKEFIEEQINCDMPSIHVGNLIQKYFVFYFVKVKQNAKMFFFHISLTYEILDLTFYARYILF